MSSSSLRILAGEMMAADRIGGVLPADREGGNMVHARHLGVESEGCIVFAEDPERLVATIGLKHMVIVDTGRALLVMPKDRA